MDIMFLKNSLRFSFLLLWLFCPSSKKKVDTDVYAELSIPKLQLQEPIYLKESKKNDVDQGLYLLPASDYLEREDSQMVILSHSGNASVSYFKHLDQLRIFDTITIKIKGTTYFFKVLDIYEEEKDGKIAIKKPKEMSLVLVTCTKYTNHLQTIVLAKNTGKLVKND